ncbi:MAG: 30S ribosome-binding factor RbfA [Saccharofermentanales bacterium]|jgi:ribosome-binding factor A|nr:30S ribosome-binding factor RbfA [Clostridiaceae bacterium]
MTRRSDRIGDEIRRILAETMQRKLKDPRLHGIVSLTEVVVSSDLSTARVFYSVYGDEEKSEVVRQAFGKATPFLRRTLSENLRTRRIPRLIFEEDYSMKEGERMDALIRRIQEESARSRANESEVP